MATTAPAAASPKEATLLPEVRAFLATSPLKAVIGGKDVAGSTGETIKTILEDVCDNFVNPDPYYRQGGDMVRVGGMTYRCEPGAKMGARIQDMRLGGKPIDAAKTYKVAGWAPVAEGATGEPIWDLVSRHLRATKIIRTPKPNQPTLVGTTGNHGLM